MPEPVPGKRTKKKEVDINVLLITDDAKIYDQIETLLAESKNLYSIHWIKNYKKAISLLTSAEYDVYIVGAIENRNGMEMIRESIRTDIKKPLILISEEEENEFDLSINAGATDVLIKDQFNTPILERTIRHSILTGHMIEGLYEKEKKYHDLFEKSIDSIYFIDAKKRFIDVNPAMLALFGYSRDELLNMELKDLFYNLDRKGVFRRIMRKHEHVKDFEVVLRGKNNKRIYCLINSFNLKDINGKITGFQGIIHDITDRKKTEEKLRKNELYALTGRITRSIAHEVRNPLTNINLAIEQLKEDYPDIDMEFYTDIISRSSQRINKLISQLMESSKPSELNLRPYSVNLLLDDSIKFVNDRVQLKEVKIATELKAGDMKIMLDPEKARTAIVNLLVNALDEVEYETGIVMVVTEIQGKSCIISIEDNGKGIEAAQVDKLFDPFFTGKDGGMGLGLTLAKNIVSSHNGKITVESEIGKGTRFKISFPSL